MNGDLCGMRVAVTSENLNHSVEAAAAHRTAGNLGFGFLSPSTASTPSPDASPNPNVMGIELNGEHYQLLHQTAVGGDDAHRKREIRLLKNRYVIIRKPLKSRDNKQKI